VNVVEASRTLERVHHELLQTVEQAQTPAVVEAFAVALRSVKAAYDFSRGGEMDELVGLVSRARRAHVARPQYPDRLRTARRRFEERLTELMNQASTDLKKAHEAAAAAEQTARAPALTTRSKAPAKRTRAGTDDARSTGAPR